MTEQYWLNYGGGVNSTALTVLLFDGTLPQYRPIRFVFADTGNEKDETYEYIEKHYRPYLESQGHQLETVNPKETVLQRWQRLRVTGSRILRTCTQYAKREPIDKHLEMEGGGIHMIGIDAGEAHRARPREGIIYPLVELDIDREDCEGIIKKAGLPIPRKSGCWCCPFARVSEVIELIQRYPCRAQMIEDLENAATEKHGPLTDGTTRTQFSDRPMSYWRERAQQDNMFVERGDPDMPCDCYDG